MIEEHTEQVQADLVAALGALGQNADDHEHLYYPMREGLVDYWLCPGCGDKQVD